MHVKLALRAFMQESECFVTLFPCIAPGQILATYLASQLSGNEWIGLQKSWVSRCDRSIAPDGLVSSFQFQRYYRAALVWGLLGLSVVMSLDMFDPHFVLIGIIVPLLFTLLGNWLGGKRLNLFAPLLAFSSLYMQPDWSGESMLLGSKQCVHASMVFPNQVKGNIQDVEEYSS